MFKRKKIKRYLVDTIFEIDMINYVKPEGEKIKLKCHEKVWVTDLIFENNKFKRNKSITKDELRHYLFHRIYNYKIVFLRTENEIIEINKPYILDIKIEYLEDWEGEINSNDIRNKILKMKDEENDKRTI